MRIHLIAIGGAAMHNIALELNRNGHQVTGSDDEIYDPSRSRLATAKLLPKKMGWNPELIHQDIDAVILGMHARPDNPELKKAQDLCLKIYSYPSFIAEQAKEKQRIVIAGSHGKTTTTAMILHVLQKMGRSFDYLVGAQLEGFDYMCQISDAPIIVIEGDEYLSSPIDRRPKMLHYKPDIAVITGIAWDHINVFKTYQDYEGQFITFVEQMSKNTKLFCCDTVSVKQAMDQADVSTQLRFYNGFESSPQGVVYQGKSHSLAIFGQHNMENLKAAFHVCESLGISADAFFEAISDFSGAAKRLELIFKNENSSLYKDFAHAPSKVMATVKAMKEQFPSRPLVAFLELHTFSSLNAEFIVQYKKTLAAADKAYVYFNKHVFEMKKMQVLSDEQVAAAFCHNELSILHKPEEVEDRVEAYLKSGSSILMMTSGAFGGFDYEKYKL